MNTNSLALVDLNDLQQALLKLAEMGVEVLLQSHIEPAYFINSTRTDGKPDEMIITYSAELQVTQFSGFFEISVTTPAGIGATPIEAIKAAIKLGPYSERYARYTGYARKETYERNG